MDRKQRCQLWLGLTLLFSVSAISLTLLSLMAILLWECHSLVPVLNITNQRLTFASPQDILHQQGDVEP
jgi:hypothetical protein